MTKGKVEKAERIALNQFDKWNDITGFVAEDTSYYYELQSVIEDAVHIGIQMAINGKVTYNNEGEIQRGSFDLSDGIVERIREQIKKDAEKRGIRNHIVE